MLAENRDVSGFVHELAIEDREKVFLAHRTYSALYDAKVRTLGQYKTFVLPLLANVLAGYGVDVKIVCKKCQVAASAAVNEVLAVDNEYGILSLSPLPALAKGGGMMEMDPYMQHNLTECYERAVEWARAYIDLEFILLGNIINSPHVSSVSPCPPISARHVVCIYYKPPPSPRHPCGNPAPLPQADDVCVALFLEEINESLESMAVTELSSYISHVLPLLAKVLGEYGVKITNCQRKTSQTPAEPYLDTHEYLLLDFST